MRCRHFFPLVATAMFVWMCAHQELDRPRGTL